MKDSYWFKTTLGDNGEFRNGVNFNREQEGVGLAILKVKDFGNQFFVPTNDLDELNPHLIEIPENQMLKEGDIVIIRSNGNSELVGRSLFFRGANKPVTFSGFCIRFRPNPEKILPLFAAYFIRSPFCRRRFTAYGSGTGIQNLNHATLSQLPLNLPPLSVQQAIISILYNLDEKIALNRQINKTLEAIAEAVFKSWFVDFDPVRAKIDGLQPFGMDAETAALFSNSFEHSTLGEIPKGWDIKPIDQIADFLNGLALQKYPPVNDEYLAAIKIAELRKGISGSSDKVSPKIEKKYIVEDADVLFSWSGSLEVVIWCGGKGALNQHLFKVTSTKYPKWFYYHWIKYHLPEFRAIAAGKATTMGHIQRHHLSSAYTVIPPTNILDKADEVMSPIFDMIVNNEKESQSLANILNALLPKLLSGEIRVKEAERVVEAHL